MKRAFSRARSSLGSAARARAGLTLIELVLALGLLSLLMLAVFQLIDRSLSMWRQGETRRSLLEMSSTVEDMLASDLRGLEPGARGDLLVEWVRFRGDDAREIRWPRIRLVRQASAADVERILAQAAPAKDAGATKPKSALDEDDDPAIVPASPSLVEVVWLVAPASLTDPVARAEGILWRGERLLGDARTKSFFDPNFFGASNRPPAGATDEVTGGVLWMKIACATQTSVVHDGWTFGAGLDAAATSWDAWNKRRPDADVHAWNEPSPSMPRSKDRPILPRRVRLEFEFERPVDRLRRTTLLEHIDLADSGLRVDDPEKLPRGSDLFVLVDTEWMKVLSIDGNQLSVLRAQRGTRATIHEPGAMIHSGERLVREVTVATYREDWDLR